MVRIVNPIYGRARELPLIGVNDFGVVGVHKPEFCDLSTFFRTFRIDKVLSDDEKASSSASFITFATYVGPFHERLNYNQRVAIKTFLTPAVGKPGKKLRYKEEFLLYEAWLYENRIKRLTSDGNAVNFVKCYATGNCILSEMLATMGDVAKIVNAPAFIRGIENRYNDPNSIELVDDRGHPRDLTEPFSRSFTHDEIEVNFIITELAPGKTIPLDEFLDSASAQGKRAIHMQVMHALLVMENYRIQHNDLHNGNILVELNPAESAIEYAVRGVTYGVHIAAMDQPAKVLLFDWDRGTYDNPPDGIKNERLMEWACEQVGQCPDFVPTVDAVTYWINNGLIYDGDGIPGMPPNVTIIAGDIHPCFTTPADRVNCKRGREPGTDVHDYLALFPSVSAIIYYLTVKNRYFHKFLLSPLTRVAIEFSMPLFAATRSQAEITPDTLVPEEEGARAVDAEPLRRKRGADASGAAHKKVKIVGQAVQASRRPQHEPGDAADYSLAPIAQIVGAPRGPVLRARRKNPPPPA